jgi:hypothetical protein
MHPLGGVGSGPPSGRTALRVTGSGPAPAGSGGAGEPQREATVQIDSYFSELYRFLYGSRLFFVFALVDNSV